MLTANKHTRRYSSFITREMKLTATMRYQFTTTWMARVVKNSDEVGEDMEKSEPSYIVGGNVGGNVSSLFGKEFCSSSKS